MLTDHGEQAQVEREEEEYQMPREERKIVAS